MKNENLSSMPIPNRTPTGLGLHPIPEILGVRAVVGRPPVSTLIYADTAGCSELLGAGLARLGRHSTIVRSPAEAITLLRYARIHVDAAFVSLQDVGSEISTFFGCLKEYHPRIRRIAFAQHGSKCRLLPSVHSCEHEMILWDPWERIDFDEILESTLDRRPHRPRSSWPDSELFSSLQGDDSLAVTEIIKRYRHRIVGLVMDEMYDDLNAEEVVQEACLEIMRHLPFFRPVCSPGHWIDDMCRMAISSSLERRDRHQNYSRSPVDR